MSKAEQMIIQYTGFQENTWWLNWKEELRACFHLVESSVDAENLTLDTFTLILQKAYAAEIPNATYLLAFRAIEHAAKTNKLTPEILQTVETCVMLDKHPKYPNLKYQTYLNEQVMRKLMTNQYLFELMLPYMTTD
jgi:hypothetical protein